MEMPSLVVKLYSIFFKYNLKQRLQTLSAAPSKTDSFGIISRLDEPAAPANPSFTDGVATKDIHVDPFSALSLRLFLPDSVLASPYSDAKPNNSGMFVISHLLLFIGSV